MELFGMGIGELLLVLVVALIIWGPQKLPEIARTLGKTVSTLRKASTDLTTQIKREIDVEEKASKSADKPAEKSTGDNEENTRKDSSEDGKSS